MEKRAKLRRTYDQDTILDELDKSTCEDVNNVIIIDSVLTKRYLMATEPPAGDAGKNQLPSKGPPREKDANYEAVF